MPTAKFSVPDMAGAACERRLEERLKAEQGVHGAVANSTDGCVEVDFEDDEVGIADLVAAGRSAGYTLNLAG